MVLVTRGTSRLARQGGRALRNTRANAAFFTTAAQAAPALANAAKAASAGRIAAAKPGMYTFYTIVEDIHGDWD